MTLVRIEKRDRIAIVAFDRGSPANPLSLQLLRELTAAADTFADDTSTGAVILTGRPDNFTMGFDLKDAEYAGLRRAGIARQHAGLKIGTRMCRAWQEIPALTVSAIEGWCVGGGIALAVATDLRVVGEHARCYVPEIERGMNMSWGSVPRIVNLVGPARAKRIVLLAEKSGRETGARMGSGGQGCRRRHHLPKQRSPSRKGRFVATDCDAHVQAGYRCVRQRARARQQSRRPRSVHVGAAKRGFHGGAGRVSGEARRKIHR